MKQNTNRAVNPMAAGLIVGVVVCIGITLIGAAICAAFISSETIAAGNIGYCAMVILLLASIAGTAVGAGKTKEKRLYVCLLVGAIYLLSLLAATALFFGGRYEGVGATAFIIFAGSFLVVFLGLNRGKRSNLRKSKIRHR